MQIALSRMILDPRAQPRAGLDTAVINEYAEAMRAGETFPPLTVFSDGKRFWLADGFHRHGAAGAAEFRDFACTVKNGTLRDAILFAMGSNARHGLRRSGDDKRRAVRILLEDEEWSQWSDREIARRCAVTHSFVGKLREEMRPAYLASNPDRMATRAGGKPYTMKTENIGKRRHPEPERSIPYAADAPPFHEALAVLARGIIDIRATPQEIVGGCIEEEKRDDLHEACGGAVNKLRGVQDALRTVMSEAA